MKFVVLLFEYDNIKVAQSLGGTFIVAENFFMTLRGVVA